MNKTLVKNILIGLAAILLIGISVTSCLAILPKKHLKPSDYDNGVTFEQASQEDKPIIGVFYVDWCTYCKKFMPKLDTVRNMNKGQYNVVLFNSEDPKNEKMVNEYKISGYPTVYIIDPKYDNRVHIDGAYLDSVSALNREAQRYLNFRKLVKKGDSCK